MSSAWTTPRFGTTFNNGRLILFRHQSITVIKPWPPAAWKRTPTREWRGCRPDLKLDLSSMENDLEALEQEIARISGELPFEENLAILERDQRHAARISHELNAWSAFCSAIPEDALQVVRPFRERQFALLSMLARCPGALELARTNPVLAWAVSTNWIWRRPRVTQPMRAARRLVLLKRREIAEWLGFPGTESAVRILAKYPPETARIRDLFYLRKAMNNEGARRRLGHLPSLNATVIRVLSNPVMWPRVSPSLLEQVALCHNQDLRCSLSYVLTDVIDSWMLLGRDIARLRIRSFDQLATLSEELNAEVEVLESTSMNVSAFPPSPIPAVPGVIEPIRTPNALKHEGTLMKNCAVGYALRMQQGLTHLFRVLQPERATLSIVQQDGHWILSQCLAAKNKNVRLHTLCAVVQWLAEGQGLAFDQVVPETMAQKLRPHFENLPPQPVPWADPRPDDGPPAIAGTPISSA